jgi:superfamily II DNA or RNA helicase
MNLDFHNVKEVKVDGRKFMLQRANVTDHKGFWPAWRYAKKLEADAAAIGAEVSESSGRSLTSSVSLTRENSNGRGVWWAYRLLGSESTGISLGRFDLAYVLRDVRRLLPYQPVSVRHICNSIVSNGAAIDGSDTGIGKTFVALSVCRNLGLRPAVVCRKAGIATWERACTYMKVPAVFITNWEQAKSEKFAFTAKRRNPYNGRWHFKWRLPKNTILIFDEAHMGNHDGSQNSALWIASRGYASLSLSATFADKPSRLKSLFTVLNIMPPEKFEEWLYSRGSFKNRYNESESLSPVADMVRVNAILFPRYGYRLSYDLPEVKKHFPRRVIQTMIVNLSGAKQEKQNREYRKMLEKVAKYKAMGLTAEALTADLRFRQAAELYKGEVLCDLTQNYVAQGHSVVIFLNFRDTLRYCSTKLRCDAMIYGGQKNRQEVIDEFQADRVRTLLCMVDAGGQSISLHDLRGTRPRVSLLAPTYNPVSLRQALGRTYRSGTKSTPLMKLVYAANTVEEKVAANVNLKLANISALNDGDLMEPDLLGLLRAGDRKVET